ncbi:hypothetical protein [Rhodanobacter sp. DHB23]|uniref:hypothetical protein n=1 Tax=Rhodanobacter sp. DHB23 TaxID=2775923 RepID=UPI001781B491|nr:hypothetical protein [Rhodanobacter sp. DHB23]MBD8872702.1 hypothetical protein [Rhodanobacter sp. DHB23]
MFVETQQRYLIGRVILAVLQLEPVATGPGATIMQRIVLLLLLLLTGSLCSMACQADAPSCATDTTLLQASTSTSAQVAGSSGEHLSLYDAYPYYDPRFEAPPSPDMYLLTGNTVEVIATCDNYAYVRYQGSKLISAGWVEKARLHATGAPHARPSDTVAQVCAAAANIINRDGSGFSNLPYLPLAATPDGMQDKISQAANGDDGNIDGLARIKIDGHAMKVFPIEDGGSCPSDYLQIWPDDLSGLVTRTTADNTFADGQRLVQVLGHPLVLQVEYGSGNEGTFSLESLSKDGQRNTLCTATQIYTPRPRDLSGSANPICHAVVANQTTAIPVQAAANKTALLPKEEIGTFELSGTSQADLRNEGKPLDVGLMRFHYDSGGGCGSTDDATFPVILNAHGVADLTDNANKQLIKAITGVSQLNGATLTSPSGGRLITYAGHIYFVTYAEPLNDGNTSNKGLTGVVELTPTGSQHVCSFQPYQFKVEPTPGLAKQIMSW